MTYNQTAETYVPSLSAEIIPFVSQRIAQAFSKTAPKADLALVNGRIWAGNRVTQTIAAGKLVYAVGHMTQNKELPRLAGCGKKAT